VIFHEQVKAGEGNGQIGGKAAGLGLLLRQGLRVPPFFVVLPDDELKDLEAAVERLGPGPYAVRSSALAEDGVRHSFAGQLESYLNVRGIHKLRRAVLDCRASGHSERVRAYCATHGIEPGPVAVVVQRMIKGQASGVMFTRDPDRPEQLLISAAWGLGEGVVQGSADCDEFRVDASGAIHAAVESKQQQVALYKGAPAVKPVPASKRQVPVLDDAQVSELARMGRRLEQAAGCPQDVEWTLEGEQLWLLQARPITTPVPWGRRLLWDNSNIVESYSGVTTPLTYSFARRAYSIVYRLFCGVMGVSGATVRENDAIFERLIGLVKGRVYYNLNAWYRILTLLPGFQYNRHAMEQMMGVSEVAADEDAEAPASSWQKTFVHLPRLGWLLLSLGWRLLWLRWDVRRFKRSFEATMAVHRGHNLRSLEPSQLLAVYDDLQRRLLWAWTPPIVNDFFVMIFHASLKKSCTQQLCEGDEARGAELANALLAGEGGLESTAPTLALLGQAAHLRRQPQLLELFTGPASDAEVLEQALLHAGFSTWLQRWMERFGDRCVDELKLETTPLRERPVFLVSTLRNYLRARPLEPGALGQGERERRAQAELHAERVLTGHRALLFRWVLGRTRECVRERENLRFLRTRIFGLVRDVFRAMGGQMVTAGELQGEGDVFYLHLDELFGWVEGTLVGTDLQGLVELRRVEFEGWRQEPAPPERFHTWGPVHRHNRFQGQPQLAALDEDGLLCGTPCYPGLVQGPAAVLFDPGEGARLDGQILVTPRTDPGWVPLFPSVSGLLVERGSALSHSAVVARELGIPAIVGLRGLTQLVQDGQLLKMDGSAGTVDLDQSE